MKRLTLAACLVIGAAAACAQQHAPPVSLATGHAAATGSHHSPVYTDGKCHFRLRVVLGQGYNDRTYMFFANNSGNPNGWGFSFGCNAGASQDEIDQQLDAKKINGKWVWYNPGVGNIPENPPFTPAQHFRAYKFSGKNWKGTAISYDDTTGDEATRERKLFFCLVETGGPQVLCGGPISVMALVDPPSTSTLPKIMAVLKTVEFVNAPEGAPASDSTAATH